MPERIGVFGGTFDPIHVGHLVTAVNVRHALALDCVLLVVANDPWQKATLPVTPAPHRLAMVEAAVAGVDGIQASSIEIERGGVSYTADTLADLHRAHPGAELYVILGSDAAASLATWERIDEVLAAGRLVVVTRPGPDDAGPPPHGDHLVVEVPRLEVSSTDLRARFVDGRPLEWLVPEPVVHVIRQRGLYAEGQMSPSRSATP